MNIARRAAINVSAIWLNLILHAAVGFFLSPFILHRLGDDLFSLWVLVFTVTGYSGLLDLGIRSAIVRYVAKYASVNNQEALSEFVNTSFSFYLAAGMFVLLLTGVGYAYFPDVFKLPSSELSSARGLLLIAGTGVAVSFPFNVFMGILEGLQQFAVLGMTQVGFTLLRGALIVIALRLGERLIGIGLITVGINLLSYIVYMCIALRVTPIRLSWATMDRNALRHMISYGAYAFIILVAEKLRFQSDVTVIGAFLSTTAITSFTIGAKLVEYSTYAVRSMAQIFTPISSGFHETGKVEALRTTALAGNRACALIVFPICLILVLLGKTILGLWVGPRYLSSYTILVILVIPKTLYLAQSASIKMLLGVGKHKVLALVIFAEGVVNVFVSIMLAHRFGVTGVALGTAIPLTLTSLLFLPYHTCHSFGLCLGSFLRKSYLLPLAACVPSAATVVIIPHAFASYSYRTLCLQLGGGFLAYCLALYAFSMVRAQRGISSWRALRQLLEPM